MTFAFLNESTPYMEYVVGFCLAISALHFYLDVRQLKALQRPSPPPQVAHLYASSTGNNNESNGKGNTSGNEDFKKKQAYQIDKLRFGMVHAAYETSLNVGFLLFYFYPITWRWSAALLPTRTAWLSRATPTTVEILQSIVWVLLISIISTVMNLPWSVYKTFSLEARHGFNKTTPKTFVTDMIKSLVLTFVLAPPIIAAIVLILLKTGPLMPVYLWTFIFTLSIVMMTLYPTLVAPLFNRYDALPDGELKEKIQALATMLKFPLKKLFVVDGSKRSAHSNAYMYGFFNNKRIVLYDTLLSQCTDNQVVAVLAHELGHWKLRHTPVLFVASQCLLAAQLSLFAVARFAPGLYSSFGFVPGERPALAAMMLFQLIIGPVDEVLGLLQNVISRAFEFQADAFGASLGWGAELKAALCVLDKENKGAPNVDRWYSAYHYSHPPLPERLAAIDENMKDKKA